MKTQAPAPYEMLGTKVSPDAAARLDRLAAARGLTRYELLQMMCDVAIRYMDDRHNLGPEINRLMTCFEHMAGWHGALNLADPAAAKEVAEAVYVLQSADPARRRHGFRCVMVSRPFMGEWQETANVQEIFERMVERLLPGLYRRLRLLAVEGGHQSLVDLLLRLADTAATEGMDADLRRGFEDADRSDHGRKPAAQPYRRHPRRDVDSQPGLLDFRPHGDER